MAHHETKSEEYNPARDYSRVMNWFKWGAIVFIVVTIMLRYLLVQN